ncbi:hypothetical protein R3W88_011969 [Solanum pinnatisectum]|uniref:PB1-like domain-containing protein n=1 Tax=Solanum pinnatisectum TaxID=50273 RepID=A0AAV9L7M1_9SOLN|nr:hypothetical protein R3W88_011969 [Solanum pinnatisectum]
MDSYILTYFHHGGCVVGNPNPTYQREVDIFGVGIDKNYFSLVEFLSYTKDLGYTNVKGFYCEDNNELVQVTSDTQLLEFVIDLVDGDEFHVYVVHEDDLEELSAPIGLLPWSDPVDESVGINTEGTVENDSDLNGVDTELPGGDTNQNEAESDLPSSDTDVDDIPNKVGVHTSQPASHSSQFTIGQSSQGSSHPEPTSSYQPGPTRFNQPASITSNSHASSTTVCGDTSRVKRAREIVKTSQPQPFVDISILVTRGITRRVATGEDSARGGPKRPTNGGSSNVEFGIYTSASGTQILNVTWTSSQRILLTGSSYKDASLTGINLCCKPRGLRWKNKDAVTTSQLQQMANKKK